MSFSVSNAITTLFSLFVVGNSTSGIMLHNQCPRFNYFEYFLRRQCPASVGVDLRCVIGLPGDVKPGGMLNCATVDDLAHPRLHLAKANEMLSLTHYRDPYGRPWCMMTFFYSPDCVFSAKIAPTVFQAASLFPKLKVVAVDVSTYTRNYDGLIAQYGVLSTPLLALWENGFLIYRLYDDSPMNLSKLVQKIRAKTDLIPVRLPYGHEDSMDSESSQNDASEDGERTVDEAAQSSDEFPSKMEFLQQFRYLREDVGFDWYFVAALIATIINLSYFMMNSEIVKWLNDRIRQQFPFLNLRLQ